MSFFSTRIVIVVRSLDLLFDVHLACLFLSLMILTSNKVATSQQPSFESVFVSLKVEEDASPVNKLNVTHQQPAAIMSPLRACKPIRQTYLLDR